MPCHLTIRRPIILCRLIPHWPSFDTCSCCAVVEWTGVYVGRAREGGGGGGGRAAYSSGPVEQRMARRVRPGHVPALRTEPRPAPPIESAMDKLGCSLACTRIRSADLSAHNLDCLRMERCLRLAGLKPRQIIPGVSRAGLSNLAKG